MQSMLLVIAPAVSDSGNVFLQEIPLPLSYAMSSTPPMSLAMTEAPFSTTVRGTEDSTRLPSPMKNGSKYEQSHNQCIMHPSVSTGRKEPMSLRGTLLIS